MIQIPAELERWAGIDVGKRELAVAIITGPADQEGEVKTRAYGTTVPALEELKPWLIQEGCTSVAMESTGSYWIPVKNILEDSVKIVLVCAKKHKPPRGDKTDFRDAQNLAHLHRHGLLKGSFLPPRNIVELRDLTRRRKKLLGNLAAEKNRVQKVLEVANVKIGSIASDVFGVSGQAMISALLSGREIEAEQIADLAKRRLRDRIPELTEALQRHHINDHHRWLIRQSVEHLVLLDQQMEELEVRIKQKLAPYLSEYELLQTIPGVKEMTAASILAEIAKRLRQLGADEKLIDEMVAKLNTVAVCSPAEQQQTAAVPSPPTPIRRASRAKVCRGALGFRARQTRKQEYSVVREQAAVTPSQARPKPKRKKLTQNTTPNPD